LEATLKIKDATNWVLDYGDMLFNYTKQRVKDDHTAKDIVQDTFLAAWRNVENYNGSTAVKTWLFSILKNKIIDYYRKNNTRQQNEITESETEYEALFADDGHWATQNKPVFWGVGYVNQIEKKEFYITLNSCLSKLKNIQSAVFSLKYLDGFESEEICKTLEITSANYWVLLHRAKTQLRFCIEKNWFLK
jgi:RNA polymerase sigma-70 factor (TIGR02943 family)